MARTTIRTEDITASEVTTAKMATDPTNASNLSSGSVPLAQLGNVDTTGIQTDVALLGFKVAANGSLAKYDLVDQTIDAFEDATGVDASTSTNEIRNASNYYSGLAAATAPTGGTITSYTGYTVHSFTSTGTTSFVVSGSGNVDWLVAAGGGGGGNNHGQGAGAGGVRTAASQAVTARTYTVTVGTAGAGGASAGGSGVNSSIAGGDITTYSSTGGGGGGQDHNVGSSGGSGGASSATGNAGGYSPVEGYAGGATGATGGAGRTGGGGGGAGAVGADGAASSSGGVGGVGISNSYRTDSGVFYGGGGGGGGYAYPAGAGGNGGGGAGGSGTSSAPGTDATANSGGGGGGGGGNSEGGDGGTGIVVIRFADGAFLSTADLTLVSNSTTAEAVPTKGDLVMTYTNGAGTATINTDIKGWVSRDNGTTYTEFTLTDDGDTAGHTILTAHDLDISAQPSGTSMRYKVTTHNQSAAKDTRIQAVSLGWS